MFESLLTVTDAAESYNLVTLARVKAELGITGTDSDDLLNEIISEESATVADYCHRVFPSETVSETFRLKLMTGELLPEELILSRRPVTAIASITENATVLASDDYETDLPAGLIYRLWDDCRGRWPAWGFKIVVAYTAGYTTTPAAVSKACLTLVKHRWSARTRDPALKSETIEGVGQKQFWVGSTGDVGDLPPEVADALDRYLDTSV
jgi:hypothetical protein